MYNIVPLWVRHYILDRLVPTGVFWLVASGASQALVLCGLWALAVFLLCTVHYSS